MEFLGMQIDKIIMPPTDGDTLSEEAEQIQLCQWIKKTYPKILFWSDLSGFRLPSGLANKAKLLRRKNGVPDLFLAYPCNGYFGLFIELKKTGTKEQNTKHFLEQKEFLAKLCDVGYMAVFAFGQEEAKEIIKKYLG